MDEVNIAAENFCADFVSVDRFESALLRLLVDTHAGEWRSLAEICHDIESSEVELREMFVSWLPDPSGNVGYSVVLFYHAGSLWSTTALYNRERLLAKMSTRRQPVEVGS